METLIALVAFLFCIVLPIALVVALAVWIIRRLSGTPAPTAGQASLDTLEQLIAKWSAQGQLEQATADKLRALIAQERLAQPAAPPAPIVPLPASIASPSAPMAPPQMAPALPSIPAAQPASGALFAAPPEPSAPPPIAREPCAERMWSALLSLRTRQTLLFLGAFLLVISALVLVVFNWASFPPILQFALLAGVCGGLWGGGAWLARQSGLERAGAGLQAVGGVLVPVVAFSLSRPGLLALAPREAWLLASALSLPIYALAAWRTRQLLFAVAGCLCGASTVLAALSGGDGQWLPLALVITAICYLPLAHWLKRSAPELAAGPFWVAHAGLPTTLLAAALLCSNGDLALGALASAIWASMLFYLLALWLEPRQIWSWATAAIPPLALLCTLAALSAGAAWWSAAPALLALAYSGLALWLEVRARSYAFPAYAGAAALALVALGAAADSWTTARWGLPLLLAFCGMLVLAYHRGRFAWLGESARLTLATLGLGLASILLPVWALALLDLTPLDAAQRGLILLPLAELYLVAAASPLVRARRSYDLVLQASGVVLALAAGMATLLVESYWFYGMAALTAIWTFQTLLRRRALWAAAALGNLLLAVALLLESSHVTMSFELVAGLGLGFAALYLLGGTLLRGTSWQCWSWPAIGWGALVAAGTLLAVAADVNTSIIGWTHVATVLALAGLLALVAALWRVAWPGYLVAMLLAAGTLLAASRGFFTGWQPLDGDFGYLLCGITLGLALLGQALRRIHPRYARPYEIVGFALLTCAPLPTVGSAQHAALTWLGMALLYALARWRYQLRWASAPALLAADLALLNGSAWLSPAGRAAGAGLLLLAAAWAQGLLGLWASRRQLVSSGTIQGTPSDNQAPIEPAAAAGAESASLAAQGRGGAMPTLADLLLSLQPGYVVALLSGVGALALASSANDVLAIVAFGLAALLALLGTCHRSEPLAWGSLLLLGLGFGGMHAALTIDLPWSMAWGVAEALALCLLGWGLDWSAQPGAALKRHTHLFAIWQRPLWLGPLVAGIYLTVALLQVLINFMSLAPLTFALATLGLLLATLAVRRRELLFAYAAGAALVGAALCQLYDWGFRQPQYFVVPAGLYLLALAEGMRRFQGQRRLSQLIEAGATMLLLGVTFGQSLRAEGLESQLYAVGLCVEALALLSYGMLRQLRVPFFGGMAFFVAGVLWLSVDPLLATNKWVLLGILGLLLVGAYVLLERRQEQLARAGRAWVERVSSWG